MKDIAAVQTPGTDPLAAHAATRDALLARIVADLQQDARCVAAWLAGSFGRGEADAVSDLDLVVVLTDSAAGVLCTRGTLVHAGTSPERLSFIGRWMTPLSIHEHHGNAPSGGTFTNVIDAVTALVIDWTLVPQAVAQRPVATLLLFDHVGIPLQPALDVPEGSALAERLSERVAFFWVLLVPVLKALVRGDTVRFQHELEALTQTRLDVEALLAGALPGYRRDTVTTLLVSNEARLEAVRAEAQRMLALHGRVLAAGGSAPADSLGTFTHLFRLAAATR